METIELKTLLQKIEDRTFFIEQRQSFVSEIRKVAEEQADQFTSEDVESIKQVITRGKCDGVCERDPSYHKHRDTEPSVHLVDVLTILARKEKVKLADLGTEWLETRLNYSSGRLHTLWLMAVLSNEELRSLRSAPRVIEKLKFIESDTYDTLEASNSSRESGRVLAFINAEPLETLLQAIENEATSPFNRQAHAGHISDMAWSGVIDPTPNNIELIGMVIERGICDIGADPKGKWNPSDTLKLAVQRLEQTARVQSENARIRTLAKPGNAPFVS